MIEEVVVRDSSFHAVHGLTARDFQVWENGQPQSILSFDVHNLDSPSISLPPNSPHPSTNNFVNIPLVPEHGPLYVILYDMVNMEVDDQIDARRQVLKFIEGKPAGTRFAIFVRNDAVYLVQGFTADKDLLYAALDPKNPKSHVPRVFLLARNFGFGDPLSVMGVMTQLTEFLDGLPGRKNLIWMAGTFPLALYPRKEDPHDLREQIKAEIDNLARAQVAVYPVNVRGVVTNPEGALTGAGPHNGVGGASSAPAGGSMTAPPAAASGAPNPNAGGVLDSIRAEGSGDQLTSDYAVQKDLARATGGRAFFSTNDVTGALEDTTEVDGNYYSLSYSPTNQNEDGKRRNIEVKVNHPGYQLSYRRYYYTIEFTEDGQPKSASSAETAGPSTAPPKNDTLQPNMKHGAPILHDLIFAAHIHTEGNPARATAEQMSQLADEPAYFRTGHKNKEQKSLAPIDLQKYAIDYRVADSTAKAKGDSNAKLPTFEFAAAAFDTDGRMLNGIVNEATSETAKADTTGKPGMFRVRQELNVPVNTAWIRIGVRNKLTDHTGTIEVQLPLAPEAATP